MSFTHITFADETNYNRGSFPGIALVSLAKTAVSQMQADITHILKTSGVGEFKWSRLHSAKRRFAAVQLIDYAIKQAVAKKLRIDILTWDVRDSRHRVPKPDRIANLQRMYYHLFRNVLRARWPDEAIWHLCPDEHTAIRWQELHGFLENNSHSKNISLLQPSKQLQKEFRIFKITPCESDKEPLIQLADLFAGIGSYSRANYHKLCTWKTQQNQGQLALLPEQPVKLSHADKVRCEVITDLNGRCKKHRLGVSLNTHHGLRTLNPHYPINFWWYTPQHEADKAPSRSRMKDER